MEVVKAGVFAALGVGKSGERAIKMCIFSVLLLHFCARAVSAFWRLFIYNQYFTGIGWEGKFDLLWKSGGGLRASRPFIAIRPR